MKFPAWSNSMTGGAADARSSLGSLRGRVRIHTLPLLSPITAEPKPTFHFDGILGQLGSIWNWGTPPSPQWGASEDAALAAVNACDVPHSKVTAVNPKLIRRLP